MYFSASLREVRGPRLAVHTSESACGELAEPEKYPGVGRSLESAPRHGGKEHKDCVEFEPAQRHEQGEIQLG